MSENAPSPTLAAAVDAFLASIQDRSPHTQAAYRRDLVAFMHYLDAQRLGKGDEWGRFEFGSTIVMLVPPGLGELEVAPPDTPVRLGQRIGRLDV